MHFIGYPISHNRAIQPPGGGRPHHSRARHHPHHPSSSNLAAARWWLWRPRKRILVAVRRARYQDEGNRGQGYGGRVRSPALDDAVWNGLHDEAVEEVEDVYEKA